MKQEQSEKILDRRLFERIPAKLFARFQDPASGREGFAQTLDISAQGLGVLTDTELPQNITISVCLQSANNCSLYVHGTVVWSVHTETGQYRVGICLEKPVFMGMSLIYKSVLEQSFRSQPLYH